MHADRSPTVSATMSVVLATVALVVAVNITLFGAGVLADLDEVAPARSRDTAASPPSETSPAPPDQPTAAPSPTTTPATGPTDTPEPDPLPSPAPADRARELLQTVLVVEERPAVPGYDRGCGPGEGCVFGTEWSDATDAPLSRNGCDTRNDVLAATLDDVRYSRASPDCDVTGGTMTDPYTGQFLDYATQGAEIHVDHVFPLAAAWDLGAAEWTPERRAAFANDTELELVAVSAGANLAKSDNTPASWLPPAKDFRCAYVTAYLEVAAAYDLAVTEADVRVIEAVLRKSC